MKKKMLIAIGVMVLLNNSVAFAGIDKKAGTDNFKLSDARVTSIPDFRKSSIETTVTMNISWGEICSLYKEFRTTGKKGFTEKLVEIIDDEDGFGDLSDRYGYNIKESIDTLVNSNEDCETIINMLLKKASKNISDKFEVKLKYRITLIDYYLGLYPSEVEAIELLSIDI